MEKKTIMLLVIFLSIAFTYSQDLQKEHLTVLNKDNSFWLSKSEHVYLSKNYMASNKLDNNISIYYSPNFFSIYHRKFDFVVHTKAILTIQKKQIQIDVVHKIKDQKLVYILKLGLNEKPSLEIKAKKQKKQILQTLLKNFAYLYELGQQYYKKQTPINCLRIAGKYTDMDFSLIIPFVFSSEENSKFGTDKKYHHWWFFPNKLSSVKTFSGITIIYIETVVEEYNWMNGVVSAQGVGTDTSIASLTNASWAGNGSSSYVKGFSRLYYK